MGDVNWTGVALVVGAILGSGGIGALVRQNVPRGGREIALINEYQEDRQKDAERFDKVEKRLDAAARRERIRDDYIMVLRQHIADGKPPPPPPFPAGLTSEVDQ